MSENGIFSGVVAPVLTPLGEDGLPDAARFVAHAARLVSEGCTGLAPFGTTSEANSLGLDERMALLEALIAGGIAPEVLMPGTGMCSIADSVRLTSHAVMNGAGAVLMLPPFYYKGVSDDGLFRHFGEVIERVGDARLKVFLYHIPPVSQVGISLELIRRLRAAYPETVVGLKDSSGDWQNTMSVIEGVEDFCVFSGSEVSLLANIRAGGVGCITATANVNAGGLRAVYDAAIEGRGEAEALQDAATALRLAIQAKPMIPMLKSIMAERTGDDAWRATLPPLEAMDPEEAAVAIDVLRREHGLGEWEQVA